MTPKEREGNKVLRAKLSEAKKQPNSAEIPVSGLRTDNFEASSFPCLLTNIQTSRINLLSLQPLFMKTKRLCLA